MRDRLDELGGDSEVALVTFTDAELLRDYTRRHDYPFAVLRDPERIAYRAYGLGRGSTARVWGVRAALRYLQILVPLGQGPTRPWRELRIPSEDPRQLGGDFVIAPDGTLAWGFWSEGPDDRPSVEALIAACAAATRDGPNRPNG